MENYKLKKEVFDKIHESIGAASMCWEKPEGAGVFKDGEAAKVAKELCDFINEHTIPKPKSFKDAVQFFFKHAWKGMFMYAIQYLYQSLIMHLGFLLFYPVPYIKCVGIFIVLRMFRSGIVNMKPDNHYTPEAKRTMEGYDEPANQI